jgi:serine protease Do
MYDLDITKDGGVKVFDNLFKKADYYDDLLKNDFGCLDRIEE